MSNCALCHQPMKSGVVVHSECMERLQKAQQLDNKPLTMNELRGMDGEPVYLASDKKWYIVNLDYLTQYGARVPCGVDMWGQGTSLSLLAECGLYRRKPNDWISVKDRPPKRFESVLVVRQSKGQPLVTIGSMDINNYWSVPGGRVKSVTHWMPMPEPPEVGA